MDEVIKRVEAAIEKRRSEAPFLIAMSTLRELLTLAKEGQAVLGRIKDQSHG